MLDLVGVSRTSKFSSNLASTRQTRLTEGSQSSSPAAAWSSEITFSTYPGSAVYTQGGGEHRPYPQLGRLPIPMECEHLMRNNGNNTHSDTWMQTLGHVYLKGKVCGAEDGIRTHDPLLGKEMLYR